MPPFSWNSSIVVTYISGFGYDLLLAGALLLFFRIRSPAVGVFLVGTLASSWTLRMILNYFSIDNIVIFSLHPLSVIFQGVGLLWYAISVGKYDDEYHSMRDVENCSP